MKKTFTWKSVIGMGLGLALVGCGPELDAGTARGGETGTASQPLTELITNGGFESSPVGLYTPYFISPGSTALTGWTVGGSGVDVMPRNYKVPASGNASLDLNGSARGSISQVIPTTSGQGYTVSFYLSGCSGQLVKVTAGTVISYNFSVTSTTSWAYRSFVFNANASTTEIKFESSYDGTCGPALDNVSVTGP